MEENFGKTGFIFKDDSEWEILSDGVQIGSLVNSSLEATINGEKKILKAGDAYLTRPDIEHGVVALEESVLIDVFTPYREDFLKK